MSWEELCQKFISACGPDFVVRDSYDNSTNLHYVRLYLRTKPDEWSIWNSTFAQQREDAYEQFFRDVIVKKFSTEAHNRVGVSFSPRSVPKFSSEEELILKLEVM